MYINDYVFNGQAYGPVGAAMSRINWEPGMLRPYFDKNGRPAVTINIGNRTKQDGRGGESLPLRQHITLKDAWDRYGLSSPVANATSLSKEQWIKLDTDVVKAARYRLRAVADLAAANSYGGFNGMASSILEHQTMSDPGEAMVDMSGLTDGRQDAPLFQLQGLPLPITHSDFSLDSRTLAISRNSGMPLDAINSEASARRVAETLEKTLIGVTTGITYGGNSTQVGGYGRTSSVYGYTNFSSRLTKINMTAPTTGGWVPSTTLAEILTCLDLLKANKFYGPFMLYTSNDWDRFMDNDYYVSITSGAVAPTRTLRERIRQIEGITDCRRLDMFFGTQLSSSTGPGTEVDASLKAFSLIFVQMTKEVARWVNGLDITTVQWEKKGGLELCFKIMTIQAPQIRADYYGNCGILHATTS